MCVTAAFLHLLEPKQAKTLGQTDMLILNCAVEANLSKKQWVEMLNKTGSEKITDILELDAADFYRCDFKPILQKRLDSFQSALYRNYWSKLRDRQAAGMTQESLVRVRENAQASPWWMLKKEVVELSKHMENPEWYRTEKNKPLEHHDVTRMIYNIQNRYGLKTGVKGGWSALATDDLKACLRGVRLSDKRVAAKQGGTMLKRSRRCKL